MKQTYGTKVIVLTRGYLTDMRKQSKKHGRKKVNREKSAEAIVLRDDTPQEVIMILSQRTLYFNNKPANDLHKSLFLFENGGNDTVYTEECYNLIKEVADSFPGFMDDRCLVLLVAAAARSYSLNIIDTTEVLAAYKNAVGTVETQLEIHPGDSRYIAAGNKID